MGYAAFFESLKVRKLQAGRLSSGISNSGPGKISPESIPHKSRKLGSRSGVPCSSCDQASRASESIPSPHHRTRTAPEEQSIRFPLLYLTCKRKLDRPL